MKKTVVLRIFFLLLVLPACRRWKKVTKDMHGMVLYKHTGQPVTDYTLIINGIECKQCIHTVLKKLGTVPSVKRVTCLCPKNDYTKSRIECTIIKTADGFPIKQINKILSRNDFVLARVLGEFIGTVTKMANNTYSFKITGQEEAFDCVAPEIVLAEWTQQQMTTREIKIFGTLDVENKRFTIEHLL